MIKGNYTFFWDGPFSQWFQCDINDPNFPNIMFNSAEQYMMYNKAISMGDEETASNILKTSSPRNQKALGRIVKNFDGKKWDEIKESIVMSGNYMKFTQNEYLKKELFSTVGTTLVEASPYDVIWGIGMGENNPDITNPEKWRGLNLLGKVLTQLRDNLLKNE